MPTGAAAPPSDELVRDDGGGRSGRAVLLTVVVVVLAGIGLAVLDTGDETAPTRDAQTEGPLGSAHWSVRSALLAASEGPAAQLRTVDGRVLAVHGGTLIAVDPASGALLWSRPARAGERVTRDIGDPSLVVTLVTDLVPEPSITAIDPATGATRWSREVPRPSEPLSLADEAPPSITPRGLAVTPAAVLVQSGDASSPVLIGIDPATGEDRWTAAHGGRIADADGEVVVLVEEHDGLDGPSTTFHVVDLTTGETRWELELDGGGVDVIADAQVVPDGPVVTADGDGNVRGHDRTDGEVVWERPAMRRGEVLVLSDEHILVTQDGTRAYVGIDAADGFLRWRHDWIAPGPVGLATGGGRAIIASADDRVVGIGLEHGTLAWEQTLERAGMLTVAGATVVHADRRGRLTGTSVSSGERTWMIGLSSAARIRLAATDGTVVTSTPRGATANHELTAWRAGETAWMTTLRRAGLGPPLVAGEDTLVIESGSERLSAVGPLLAVHLATGAVRWTAGGGSETGDARRFGPVEDGGRVLRALLGGVEAFDLAHGARAWQHTSDADVVTSPAIVGDRVFVGLGGSSLLSLRADDGGDARTTDLDADPVALVGVGDRAIAVTDDAGLAAVDADGAIIWTAPLPGLTHHAPIVVDATVVAVVGGIVVGFDLDTGDERWRSELPGPPTGPPTTTGDVVIVATTDGTVRALDPGDGRTLDHYLLGSLHAGPVSTDGLTHVVTTEGELVAIGPRDPDEVVPTPPPIHPR